MREKHTVPPPHPHASLMQCVYPRRTLRPPAEANGPKGLGHDRYQRIADEAISYQAESKAMGVGNQQGHGPLHCTTCTPHHLRKLERVSAANGTTTVAAAKAIRVLRASSHPPPGGRGVCCRRRSSRQRSTSSNTCNRHPEDAAATGGGHQDRNEHILNCNGHNCRESCNPRIVN